ncbi:hypothetical protein GCK32_017243 [Trichostrongylus colubriformis]|uniref:Uncharacterized protein n=1 Tax=Trichostrongylus colubriformis TaxID=6319 RepID=A0AAN8EVN6_TRICO
MTFPPFHGFSRRVPRREREKTRMRNSKINPIHDVVRRVAVAPKPRQCYRKFTSKHADASLSESDGDEYPKIRSYIKPNRNINTVARAMREERMMQKADRSFPTNSRKTPHKQRLDYVVSAERISHCDPSVPTVGEGGSSPQPAPRMSHVLTTMVNADEKRNPLIGKALAGTGSTSRYCKESSLSHVASASSDRVAKHRNFPIPPPQKKSRHSSPVCSASSQSQKSASSHSQKSASSKKRDPTRCSLSRLNMLCNENSNVLPSNHSESSGISEQISTTSKDQMEANTQGRASGTDSGSSVKYSNRKECSPAR